MTITDNAGRNYTESGIPFFIMVKGGKATHLDFSCLAHESAKLSRLGDHFRATSARVRYLRQLLEEVRFSPLAGLCVAAAESTKALNPAQVAQMAALQHQKAHLLRVIKRLELGSYYYLQRIQELDVDLRRAAQMFAEAEAQVRNDFLETLENQPQMLWEKTFRRNFLNPAEEKWFRHVNPSAIPLFNLVAVDSGRLKSDPVLVQRGLTRLAQDLQWDHSIVFNPSLSEREVDGSSALQELAEKISNLRMRLIGDEHWQGIEAQVLVPREPWRAPELKPQNLSDLISLFQRADAAWHESDPDPDRGRIFLLKHETRAGQTSWSVLIPGTQEWKPWGENPHSLDTNLKAVAGKASLQSAAVMAAMRAAGVKASDPVEVLGHSQGGTIAAQIAGSAEVRKKFNIRFYANLGGPAPPGKPPKGVQGITMRNSRDLVTGLGGKFAPATKNHVVVVGNVPQPRHFHNVGSYARLAQAAEATNEPAVKEFNRARSQAMRLNQRGVMTTLIEVETSRAPGTLPASVDEQAQNLDE